MIKKIFFLVCACNDVLDFNNGICSGGSRSREDGKERESGTLGGKCRQERSRPIHIDGSEG
jgi:hypothetical protein